MGGISASVPSFQYANIPQTLGAAGLQAQEISQNAPARNALVRSQAQSINQDIAQKHYSFAAGIIASALYPVTQSDPSVQPAAYKAAKQTLTQAGIDTSGMPDQYDPNYVDSALSRTIPVMDQYHLGITRAVIGALSGGQAGLPQTPGAPQSVSQQPNSGAQAVPQQQPTMPNGQPVQGATNAQPTNIPLPNSGRPTGGIPGAGPGLALDYLMNPAAGAGALRDQLAPRTERGGGWYINPANGTIQQLPQLPTGVTIGPNGQAVAVPGAPQAAGQVAYGTAMGKTEAKPITIYDAKGAGHAATVGQAMRAGATTELSPQAQSEGTEFGKDAVEYYTGQMTAGKSAQDDLLNLREMQDQLNVPGGFQPGPINKVKQPLLKLLNSIDPTHQFGIDQLGTYEAFSKHATQGFLSQARTMGSRIAAQEVQIIATANPNGDMTNVGLHTIFRDKAAMDQYQMDKTQAMQKWKQMGRDPNDFESYWQNNTDPMIWMIKTMPPQQYAQVAATMQKQNPAEYNKLQVLFNKSVSTSKQFGIDF
jgi:hypothetical protein